MIFDAAVHPFLVSHEKAIDDVLLSISNDFVAWLTKTFAVLFVLAKDVLLAASSAVRVVN